MDLGSRYRRSLRILELEIAACRLPIQDYMPFTSLKLTPRPQLPPLAHVEQEFEIGQKVSLLSLTDNLRILDNVSRILPATISVF